MGPLKCLMGPRDIGENLLQTASKFLMDGSPHTRYYGRKIFLIMMNNNSFEKLLRKHITPSMYRNISGILDSIKRRVSNPNLNKREKILLKQRFLA